MKRFRIFLLLIVSLTLGTNLKGKAMGSPIAENWIYATVRIENELGQSGTGFLVRRDTNGQKYKVFLLTNKHVVHKDPRERRNVRSLKVFFNIKAPPGHVSGVSSEISLIRNGKRLWHEHPNPYVDVLAIDVTSLIIEHRDIDYKSANYSYFATLDVLRKEDISIGEEVFIIGYPLGLSHAHSNTPLVRQGIIATKIGEQITTKIREPSGNEVNVTIPGFLVDLSVVPGSSGSPVVLKPVLGRKVGKTIQMKTATPYLLGIISSLTIASIRVGEKSFKTLADLGVAFDASTIQETIEFFFQ